LKTVEWNDRFSIGVEVVDKAHQRLFSIVGKLISLNEDPDKQQHACREGIKYFKSYTLKHFAEEEAYMQSIQYEQYELHKSLHDDMRDKLLPPCRRSWRNRIIRLHPSSTSLGSALAGSPPTL